MPAGKTNEVSTTVSAAVYQPDCYPPRTTSARVPDASHCLMDQTGPLYLGNAGFCCCSVKLLLGALAGRFRCRLGGMP